MSEATHTTIADDLRSEAVVDAYPLTTLQQGMLYHGMLAANDGTYVDASRQAISGPWHPDALVAVARRLMRRHPVLRTTFDLERFSLPVQLVHDELPCPLTSDDLRELPHEAQERNQQQWLASAVREGFATGAPLWAMRAHRLGEAEWALSLVFHHAILDGWSHASFVTELLTALDARVGGRLDPIAEEPEWGMRDYVALEMQALEDQEARAFWERVVDVDLATLPRVGTMRTQRVGPAATAERRIDAATVEAVTAAGRGHGLPLRSMLLAVHGRVMQHMTGADEVLGGVVAHGRPEVEDVAGMLGLFLNTLPTRFRPAGSWRAFAHRLQEEESAAQPHRRFPLGELQRGRPALFEVMFDFRSFSVLERQATSLDHYALGASAFEESTNLPLAVAFNLDGGDGGLRLVLRYDTAQWSVDEARAIADLYARAVALMAQDPDGDVLEADLLGRDERDRLLALGRGRRGAADSASVVSLVLDQARRTPEAPAVLEGHSSQSYGDLARAIEACAADLRAAGVGPGNVVGVSIDSAEHLVPTLLGIMRLRAAYLPLDGTWPVQRLHYMMSAAGVTVVLGRLPGGALPDGARSVAVTARTDAETDDLGDGPLADDRAYVMFTSGSTGRPKAVSVPHRGVVNLLRWVQCAHPLRDDDVVLQSSALTFDVSVMELFWPMVCGARLRLAGHEARQDLTQLDSLLTGADVTVAQFVPTLLRQLLEHGIIGRSTVRTLFSCGEALPAEVRDAALEQLRQDRVLVDVYGPTEASIQITSDVPSAADGPTVPIGRPIDGCAAYVLDGRLQPTPQGTSGELYLGGEGISWGYDDAAKTAAAFVPDPHAATPGARLYRTGDAAKLLPDGRIAFLGRRDHQVKFHGHRIELAEIEGVLAEFPCVRQAVVRLLEDAADQSLVGYVVVEGKLDVRGLRTFAAERIPAYMVPTRYAVLDALPVTPNGKVDRRALDAFRPATVAMGFEPPRGELEQRLADVWADVLGLDRVSRDASFQDLGGDSLRALVLTARMTRELGAPVSAAALLEHPTVAALTAHLEAGRKSGAGRPSSLLVRLGRQDADSDLVLIHAYGGHVFCYDALAGAVDGRRNIIGVQSAALVRGGEEIYTIEEMAHQYVEELTAVRPHGPYRLGGWCMGGLIAAAAATELQAAREEVEPLVLISSDIARPVLTDYSADPVRMLLYVVYGGQLELAPGDLEGLDRAAMVAKAFAADREIGGIRPDVSTLEDLTRVFSTYLRNARALSAYKPGAYHGDVVVFRPEEDYEAQPRLPDLGWSRYVEGRLEVVDLPGDHYTALQRPNVGELARRLLERV